MYLLFELDELEEFLNGKFKRRLENVSSLDQLFLVLFNVYDINEKFIGVIGRVWLLLFRGI